MTWKKLLRSGRASSLPAVARALHGAATGKAPPTDLAAAAKVVVTVFEPSTSTASTRTCSLSSDHCEDGDKGNRDLQEGAIPTEAATPNDPTPHLDRQTLVAALAEVLKHLTSLGQRQQVATVFHATRPPRTPINEYLTRIETYYQCSDQSLVLSLIYIDRILKAHPKFVVSPWSIHRLIMTSTMVSAKFWDDVYRSNSHYAKTGGVSVSECNALEAHFVKLLDWRLQVHPEEYSRYLTQILAAGDLARVKQQQQQQQQQQRRPCPPSRTPRS